jgi:hypothetical protein
VGLTASLPQVVGHFLGDVRLCPSPAQLRCAQRWGCMGPRGT